MHFTSPSDFFRRGFARVDGPREPNQPGGERSLHSLRGHSKMQPNFDVGHARHPMEEEDIA